MSFLIGCIVGGTVMAVLMGALSTGKAADIAAIREAERQNGHWSGGRA